MVVDKVFSFESLLVSQLHTLHTQITPCILPTILVTKVMDIRYWSLNESKSVTYVTLCLTCYVQKRKDHHCYGYIIP